ncbi:DNA-binding MarR family transcriptional regulator [Paenibacillus anaericanus]|uniref:MarR family winged helix-turn-helix transcriptional regulator n=1 Tax=Paenibacillus anaericanus TaxID=170367 RepID=UPI00277EF822|nr:MarR family winged helix-turn-helix transcriptional regulator [Paenibacillus anaericanus]MDQ0086662.1 DNA-binding MarR family transcriptional regulator [Paenibacillus anaericanus]
MKNYIQHLDLIDLLSEKHSYLRKKISEKSADEINKTESHILAMLEVYERLSISELSRIIGISRQGTHKYVQGLLVNEYVEGVVVDGNLRDKHIVLTEKGIQCCERLRVVRQQLVQQIEDKIGKEQVESLKNILKQEWL